MQKENLDENSLCPPDKPSAIDWACVWHRQMDAATFRGQGADFWDTWVRTLPAKTDHSGYVEELLNRMKLKPEYTLLDVGAGSGALSIPLAHRVQHVTALDQSNAMLTRLMDNAKRDKLDNIATLQLDWTQAKVGIDFPHHDVVLVSRSLPPSKDITNNLRSIDAAAKRFCYITWKAHSHNDIESELSVMLNIPYVPFPNYTVLYNILLSMGIHANVELFKVSGRRRYNSLSEAFIQIVRSRPTKESERQVIMQFLERNLEYNGNYYYQQKNGLWALIWWDKELQ